MPRAQAGGRYYPKLQCSIPFTPVTGRRLLARGGPDRAEREALLLQAAVQVSEQLGLSGLHMTFPTRDEWGLAGALDFLQRTDQQFHWQNDGYASFEDFLGALVARKRKAIRKERREAMAGGIEIEWVTGGDLSEAHWDAFFAFYMDTGSRKWGSPYLNRRCFSLLGAAMADRLLLVFAKRAGRYVAGALNVIGGGYALRPLLGRDRGAPVPAFRGLLPPGHRVRDRARAFARRGRRARRPQACPRLFAGRDLQRALDR